MSDSMVERMARAIRSVRRSRICSQCWLADYEIADIGCNCDWAQKAIAALAERPAGKE